VFVRRRNSVQKQSVFAQVTILSHQTTTIACEYEVIDRTLCPAANKDHFRDTTKMVFWLKAGGLPGFDRPLDGRHELDGRHDVLPEGVAHGALQLTSKPEFNLI
jgi:hypothetical protein